MLDCRIAHLGLTRGRVTLAASWRAVALLLAGRTLIDLRGRRRGRWRRQQPRSSGSAMTCWCSRVSGATAASPTRTGPERLPVRSRPARRRRIAMSESGWEELAWRRPWSSAAATARPAPGSAAVANSAAAHQTTRRASPRRSENATVDRVPSRVRSSRPAPVPHRGAAAPTAAACPRQSPAPGRPDSPAGNGLRPDSAS